MVLEDILSQAIGNEPGQMATRLRALRAFFVAEQNQMTPEDLDLFAEAVLEALPRVTILERVAFARAIARSRRVPTSVLEHLLGDTPMVAMPILEPNPGCPDDTLLRQIDGASEAVLLALARRAPLSGRVADRLYAVGTTRIRRVLAENVEAVLSFDILSAMIDEAVTCSDMDQCLANRPDLPPELAAKLLRIISARSQRRIADMLKRDLNKGQPGQRILHY